MEDELDILEVSRGINGVDEESMDDYLEAAKDSRNFVLTPDELNEMLPCEGYEIIIPPVTYKRNDELLKILEAYCTRDVLDGNYAIPPGFEKHTHLPFAPDLPMSELNMKYKDYQLFADLFLPPDPKTAKECRIQLLLLKIKNGKPYLRRASRRLLYSRCKDYPTPNLIVDEILSLINARFHDLDDQVLLYRTFDKVCAIYGSALSQMIPKIYEALLPILVDHDRIIVAEVAAVFKTLCTFIPLSTWLPYIRKDFDNLDDAIRTSVAKFLAIYASRQKLSQVILVIRALFAVNEDARLRHTALLVINQCIQAMTYGVLSKLPALTDILSAGLQDDSVRVRLLAATTISRLAETVYPYGIESFESCLRTLWRDVRKYRGKGFSTFLQAIAHIIPLMDSHNAGLYARETVKLAKPHFESADYEVKMVVLRVIRGCCKTEVNQADFINDEIIESLIDNLYNVRNSQDVRLCRSVMLTTVELARIGNVDKILQRLTPYLKHEAPSVRLMALDVVYQIHQNGYAKIEMDDIMFRQFMDALLFSLVEVTPSEKNMPILAISSVINTIGKGMEGYMNDLLTIIKWKLNNPDHTHRREGAEIIDLTSATIRMCNGDDVLVNFSLILFEYLAEEYPLILAAVISSLNSILRTIGAGVFKPGIEDVVARLTPILKNRHEKVQESLVEFLGTIAKLAGDQPAPAEWNRICFELLDLLYSSSKKLRNAAITTFGHIAESIGPHDVIVPLLNNLRLPERQIRICTTVAMAIVANSCGPYTVLPAIMNEYKIPDSNAQHGVLKALTFIFEYIGGTAADYIYPLTTLLENALMDRDVIHRQIAAWALKHLSINCRGCGKDDALLHLFNFLWPNILETAAHLRQATMDAIDGFRVSLGPATIFHYVVAGLFHPAKSVRDVYWRIYNALYTGHCDKLVPLHIDLPSSEENCYLRTDLYICL